jgi:hypothetical protein
VRIGPHEYTIYWSDEHWERLRIREDGLGHLMGRTAHHLGEIYIKPGMSPSQLRDTLLHEIMHCIYSSGLGINLSNIRHVDDLDEYLVSTVTPWLLGVLRDNPDVLAYLLAS